MRKMLLLAGIVISMITISSCDEDTASIGKSLTDTADMFTMATDTFDLSSRSIVADRILSRSAYSYLGRIKDPETSAYITEDYMTQFSTLENNKEVFYNKEDIISKEDGEIVADSCALVIVVNSFTGDSLAAMKLTAYELDKPVEEGGKYYTDFDPEKEGYIRADGLQQNLVYSIINLQLSDSVRNIYQNSTGQYYSISIPLKKTYKDKDGKEYKNYGTYLMRKYFEHPDYYKNSYTFIHNVCPGFYIKTTDGLGLMAEIVDTRLISYYRVQKDGKETNIKTEFHGTEEVLQTTRITNNKMVIDDLAAKEEWTYLKTPAGIFTEVTLPVDDIKKGHENDTITSAKVVFHKMNDKSELTDKILKDPTNLLMVQRDSLESYFENHNIPNNTSSYLATLSTKYNSYTYTNISGLINLMYNNKEKGGADYTTEHPNWNKVVLVPVKTTMTSTTAGGTISAVNHEMSITSTRLIGGAKNQHEPIKISIIYNKTH